MEEDEKILVPSYGEGRRAKSVLLTRLAPKRVDERNLEARLVHLPASPFSLLPSRHPDTSVSFVYRDGAVLRLLRLDVRLPSPAGST